MTVHYSASDDAKPASANSISVASLAVIDRLERLLVRIVAVEFLAVAGACYAASVLYNEVVLTRWPPSEQYVPAALVIALLVITVSLGLKHYVGVPVQSRDQFMWHGVGAVMLAFSLFVSLLFVLKIGDWYSRGTFLLQFGAVAAAMLAVRGTVHARIRKAIASGALEARRALLIGDGGDDAGLLARLKLSGIRSVGTLPLPLGEAAPSHAVRSFVKRCRRLRPDDIVFLAKAAELPRVARVVDALSELPVTVHIIPVDAGELWTSSKVANLGGTATIQVLHPPLSVIDFAVKRAFDICVAALGLLILSPLLIMVALAIRLDSRGPAFFRQVRHGYNNDAIRVLKFRTMTVVEDGARQFTQAVKNDHRITRIGSILRRTNIDELPQLVNVLMGEMSIVGPRPHPIALNRLFAERISPLSRRHKVKPGLTGWAQVNGLRGETDTLEKMQQRVEHDLYYIDNWSLMLDLKIVLMTMFSKRSYLNAF